MNGFGAAVGFKAIQGTDHQPPGVQQVLRAIAMMGPSASGRELDPKKIAYLAEYTVLDLSVELSVGIADPHAGPQWDRPVHL